MIGWKKLVVMAVGFGCGSAVVLAAMLGGFVWYQGRPAKPKPWDARAIVATFDYPDTELAEPEGPNGFRANTIVAYYTLENTTGNDYHMPPQDQLEVNGRLKIEKSLTSSSDIVTLDKDQIFIPAKERRRFAVHLHYPVTESFEPEPKTTEERRKKRKLIADYMNNELANLAGFVVFDNASRYQINLPNGWHNFDAK